MAINYPLAHSSWDQNELDAIQRVVDSGRFTMGPEVKQFEEQFADKVGSKHAVMTNSGSSANLIAITALKEDSRFKSEGNIVVPAVSWSTTFFPVHQNGYRLRFVDVDRNTFNIDVEAVRDAIDSNTAAVFAVNLLGNPADLIALRGLCDEAGIPLIEDNCESMGAAIDGKDAGTYGLMGTFSFFFSHHMQTMEGGMVVTDDDDLADYLRSLRAHGWVRDLPEQSKLYTKTGNDFEDSFRFVLPGYCVRPLEMSGAIGQAQLEKWDRLLRNRCDNAMIADSEFTAIPGIRLQKKHKFSSWFGFGLVCENRFDGRRADVLSVLKNENVEVRPIVAGNFTRNPVISRLNYDIRGRLDAADELHFNGFFIGNDDRDLSDKIFKVADAIRSIK